MKKILSLFAAVLVAVAVNAKTTTITAETADALRLALAGAENGDVIEMAAGTYVESNAGFIAFNGIEVTVRAAKDAVVILQPQVSITITGGATARIENIKIDASQIHAAQDAWYEHIIYATDANENNKLILDGCEIYGFPLNNSVIYCSATNKLASVSVNNCYFHNNRKSCLFFENPDMASLSVTNSTFANTTIEDGDADSYYAGNIFTKEGLATVDVLVDHCTFYNINCMNTDYGAVKVKGAAPAVVSNCIFMMPETYSGGRAVYNTAGTVKNCLTFNYGKDSNTGLHSGPTITDCLQADPKFKDAANGNFLLAEDSPARNVQISETETTTLGDPRWWEAPKLTAPDAAPAAPELNKKQVKAVYSATYNADCGFGEWGSGTVYKQEEFGKKYVTSNLGYFGLLFEGDNALNCTKMEKLHLDVWVAADTALRVVPIWKAGGEEKGVWATLKGQQWNAIDIALSEYDNVTDWSNIYQIKLDEIREQTFWVNNVYFYTTVVPPVDNDAPAEFTAVADAASYFAANIKAKATDASGAIIFTVKNGDAVVATKNAESGVEAIITVKNLKPNTEYNLSVIASDEDENAAEPVAVTVKTVEAPAAAPAPEFDAAKVLSIYSDAYATAPASIGTLNAGWWEPSEMFEGELAAGDKALFYAAKETGMFGWEFAETDMTGYPFLHINIYPIADGKIKIYPVVNGSTEDYVNTPTVKGGEWNHLVFDFRGKDLTKVFQIGWMDYYLLNGFFLDNVYFSASKAPIKPQANIFASGLKGALSADGGRFDIEYFLNANATEIEVEFFNEEGEMELKTPITKAEDLTVGAHKVAIEMFPIEIFDLGAYSWTIHAYAEPTEFKDMLPADDNRYNYYMPMSVVVDNSFESDFFGRIYVSESVDGADDGMSDATKQQVRGIYIYNPDMNFANGQEMAVLGYDGGLAGNRASHEGFRRLAIDAKGNVYVASLDADTKGVYRMDPANPAADFVTVLQAERPVDALEVVGDTLYTIENVAETSGEFDVYDMTTLPVGKPVKRMLTTAADSDKGLANPFITIRSDGRGGFWVAQNRWGATPYPPFEHWNSSREVDFKIDGDLLGDVTGNASYRGQIAVNVAGDKIAIGSNKCAKVYSVAYGDDGVPALTFICMTPQFGNNIDGLAFDIADNLYVASASVERFYQFPLAKEEGANHTRVYAPSKYNLVIKDEDAVDNISTTVAPVKVLRDGQVLIIRDGVEYNVLGNAVK